MNYYDRGPGEVRHHVSLGAAALTEGVEVVLPDCAQLPAGYCFAEEGTIQPGELAATLYISDSRSRAEVERAWIDKIENLRKRNLTPISIGVRNELDGQLVGFGSLVVDKESGVGLLCNFRVDIEHRGRGVGRAIIDQRLLQAAMCGLRCLRIPHLSYTNTLRSYYIWRGFRQDKDGIFVLEPVVFAWTDPGGREY